MSQYTGQITVIIEASDEAAAESGLRAIARQIQDEADGVVFADHNGDVEDYEAIEAECRESLESGPTRPSRFDNYEISPCRRYEQPDSPGKFYFEVCEPDEADVWTLYGHVNGDGVQAIGDFANREAAEEVFFRITGVKFRGSYEADSHLRVMHAGPKLLAALIAASDWIDAQVGKSRTDVQSKVQQAIAEATGRAA